MVEPVAKILLLLVVLCSSQVNGEYKYGLQASVLRYPDRLRELLPDGIPEKINDFYVPSNGLSEKCKADSKSYLEGLNEFQPWAVKMLDASSKLPSGLMQGHLHDIGNYDECLDVKLGSPFKNQFCMIHFPGLLPQARYSQKNLTVVTGGMPILYPDLMLSLCLPASCTLEDLKIHYENQVKKFNATAQISRYDCSTIGTEKLDSMDWVAVAYLVIILFLILSSTFFEILIECTKPRGNETESRLSTKILTSFSLINNSRRILATTDPKRSLSFMNGLRSISIIWIVVAHHYYMNSFFVPSLNNIVALEAVTDINLAWIMSATLSVDTFFVMSGFLLAYLFLNVNKDKGKIRFNILFFYIHRYMRYAPALITTILMSSTLFNYIGDGPLWNHFTIRHKEFCRTNWWTNLLFLNNYINIEEQCASFTWFLCVDMQLYILSPLVLLPMRKYKNFAFSVLPLLIIAAMINSFIISYINELPAGSLNSRDLSINVTVIYQYTRAHIRIAPWLVGMILGSALHKIRNKKFTMSKFTVTCGWVLSLTTNLIIIYGVTYFYQDDYIYEKNLASFYTAVHRTIWALGIAWIIFACETGYGGPLNKCLSWPFFQPIGKLTFAIYIVHGGYQYSIFATARGPSYFGFNNYARNILGEIFASIFLAFVASVMFEVPFRNLEKIILEDSKRKKENIEENGRECHILDSRSTEEKGTDIP